MNELKLIWNGMCTIFKVNHANWGLLSHQVKIPLSGFFRCQCQVFVNFEMQLPKNMSSVLTFSVVIVRKC